MDQTGVEYKVELPDRFGYKALFVSITPEEKIDSNTQIELAITNINEEYLHIVSPNFFSGKLSKGDTAIIFSGSIQKLMAYYNTEQPPSISNSKDKSKILISLKSSKKIHFNSSVIISMEAMDYP